MADSAGALGGGKSSEPVDKNNESMNIKRTAFAASRTSEKLSFKKYTQNTNSQNTEISQQKMFRQGSSSHSLQRVTQQKEHGNDINKKSGGNNRSSKIGSNPDSSNDSLVKNFFRHRSDYKTIKDLLTQVQNLREEKNSLDSNSKTKAHAFFNTPTNILAPRWTQSLATENKLLASLVGEFKSLKTDIMEIKKFNSEKKEIKSLEKQLEKLTNEKHDLLINIDKNDELNNITLRKNIRSINSSWYQIHKNNNNLIANLKIQIRATKQEISDIKSEQAENNSRNNLEKEILELKDLRHNLLVRDGDTEQVPQTQISYYEVSANNSWLENQDIKQRNIADLKAEITARKSEINEIKKHLEIPS